MNVITEQRPILYRFKVQALYWGASCTSWGFNTEGVQRSRFNKALGSNRMAPAGSSTLAGPTPGRCHSLHSCTSRALNMPGRPLPGLHGRAPRTRGSGGAVEAHLEPCQQYLCPRQFSSTRS